MTDNLQCWSCGNDITSDLGKCPHCGVDLTETTKEANSEKSLSEEASEELDQDLEDDFDFAIPDMDYVEGTKEESSSPKGEFDVGYDPDAYDKIKAGQSEKLPSEDDEEDFAIPDMDYVEGTKEESSSPKGEFDVGYQEEIEEKSGKDKAISSSTASQTTEVDEEFFDFLDEDEPSSSPAEAKLSDNDKQSMLADMDTLFDEPEVIDDASVTKTISEEPELQPEEVQETDVQPDTKVTKLLELPGKSLLWLFGSQMVYWTFIFAIIVFASFEITFQEFQPDMLGDEQFNLHPIGLIISWLAFLVMGWFYSYKLRVNGISPSLLRGIFLLSSIFLFILVISQLLILIIGGDQINNLLIAYYQFIPIYYIIGFFTGGWFSFALGYKIAWDWIYNLTPMSNLEPSLSEL